MKKILIPKIKIKETIQLLSSNKFFITEDKLIYEDKWASIILSCFTRKTWGSFYTLAMSNIIEKDSMNAVVEIEYINSAKYFISYCKG